LLFKKFHESEESFFPKRKLKNIFVKEDKFINKLAPDVFFSSEIFYRF